VTAWLVEHVSDVLTKYLVGADGHSAYERLFGKQAREEGSSSASGSCAANGAAGT
jgi:hypothetical protein